MQIVAANWTAPGVAAHQTAVWKNVSWVERANEGDSFPLTANGLRQARAMARRFSSLEIRAVYTSPILRAMQTAEEICKIKKIEMQVTPELSEYNMGLR